MGRLKANHRLNMSLPLRAFILPGWQNSGLGHWQSRWEVLHGFVRVQQADWQHPLRGDWMTRLEDAVLDEPAPVALVAHSLGCQLVAAWAAHSAHTSRVSAALLVAPPDTARADMPPQLSSWRHIVGTPLPFPALVLYSDDDPFCAPDRALAMAEAWRVPAQSEGARGHLNADSGLGDWPQGLARLHALVG
jgi:predicted alpha/beta hydrolase family esterase